MVGMARHNISYGLTFLFFSPSSDTHESSYEVELIDQSDLYVLDYGKFTKWGNFLYLLWPRKKTF